jgi:hypothetical protein
MSPKKNPKRVPPVDTYVQETSICAYRNAKVWDIYTTNHSFICLMKRRGWEPVTGKKADAAKPYLIFRLPTNKLTIRSKPKAKKKVKK